MEYDFNPSIYRLRESPTRKIDSVREKLAREGRDIILLSTGQPSIPPPRWVREELAERLLADDMRLYAYTPSQGRGSVRDAIRRELARHGVEVGSDQITLTAGGQSALFSVAAALFKPGDRVVVFDPMYFGYWPLLDYIGAEAIVLREDLDAGFQPPIEELKETLSRVRVKGVILVSPDNPTGRVVDGDVARALADLAVDYGFIIITDEAYRSLVYEGEHIYLYNLAPENVVSVNTFSKDPGIPGWRLGFVYGPREIVEKVKLLVSETVYCPPSIAQELVEIYLGNPSRMEEHLKHVRSVYATRRDALVEALRKYLPKARFIVPRGGMFVFADLKEHLSPLGLDADRLAELLLTRKGVAVVPGSYFSQHYKYAVRFSFVSESEERIREGVKRIAELLGEL